MTLSQDMVDRARRGLDEELETIQRELRDLGANPDGSVEVSFDDGFADAAQSTSERSKVLSIVENLQKRLAEVRAALQRIDRGTYGQCERCGNDINAERLEAIRSVRLCISCAQKR